MVKCNRCQADTELSVRGMPMCTKCAIEMEDARLHAQAVAEATAKELRSAYDQRLPRDSRNHPYSH